MVRKRVKQQRKTIVHNLQFIKNTKLDSFPLYYEYSLFFGSISNDTRGLQVNVLSWKKLLCSTYRKQGHICQAVPEISCPLALHGTRKAIHTYIHSFLFSFPFLSFSFFSLPFFSFVY